ncbi:MAG: hypothetical protein R3A47_04980 [Polyangiales bacterium]
MNTISGVWRNSVPGYASVLVPGGSSLETGLIYNTATVRVSELQALYPSKSYEFPRAPFKSKLSF